VYVTDVPYFHTKHGLTSSLLLLVLLLQGLSWCLWQPFQSGSTPTMA
jgi:hypothetical protein